MAKKTAEAIIKLLFRGIIPLASLISGVVLFVSEVSGWGLILGIPMIIIGMIMLIYTYDEAIQKKVISLSEELTRCSVCGKLTPRVAGKNPEDMICNVCKKKISKVIAQEKRR